MSKEVAIKVASSANLLNDDLIEFYSQYKPTPAFLNEVEFIEDIK